MKKHFLLLCCVFSIGCGATEERAVTITAVRAYPEVAGNPLLRSNQLLRRGQPLLLVKGREKVVQLGEIRQPLVLARIPGQRQLYWIPEREYLPGGLVEQRVQRGFYTKMYLTRDTVPGLLPGAPPLFDSMILAGTGLIVVGKRGAWVRAHVLDRFLWLQQPGLDSRPFVPFLHLDVPVLGRCNVASSPWRRPAFGEERRYSPDKLFLKDTTAAWITSNSGLGATLSVSWKRAVFFTVAVVNGYGFSPLYYRLYNRLERCRVTVDGVGSIVTLHDGLLTPQGLGRYRGKSIRIEVLSLYPGEGRRYLALQHLQIIPDREMQ